MKISNRVSSEREVSKIQDEFLRVFKTKDLRQLERFHRQLDIIAEGYRARQSITAYEHRADSTNTLTYEEL